MSYDGTTTGDVLLYECQKGYIIVGESTSVCMIYGSWSHKTPRCKGRILSFPIFVPNTINIFFKLTDYVIKRTV